MRKYSFNFENTMRTMDYEDIPFVGDPGKKCVVLDIYYGASKPIRKAFIVDAKTDMDVYNEASRQCKLVAEQEGHDAMYKVISIEDVE